MAENVEAGRPEDHCILIVDDDLGQRSLLDSFLSGQGFKTVTAASGEEALTKLAVGGFAMMISDVRMPGMSGIETLRKVREDYAMLPVLLVTAYADVRDAVEAMRDGAVDYLEKPIDLEELFATVRGAVGLGGGASMAPELGFSLPTGVIVDSPQMRSVFQEVALVAPSDTRVLITGESGVGKEIVADVLHAWSPRCAGPLVKVNCAAIPETLLESELFGHEKGAFTGAEKQRIGRFEEADGGTILLDEVAEMSPLLQAKLLRVTQDGSFQRIGSNVEHTTDARVVAATNRNLEQEVSEGRFREDLFFRLNVMEIFVPPLRERQPDIGALANRFATEFTSGKPRFSPAAFACLELYAWPGNVRELRNAMERAALLSRGEVILPEHLPKRVQRVGLETGDGAGEVAPGKRMEEVERVVILQALRDHGYNRTETARALGISRRALLYKVRRYKEQGYPVEA